MNSAFEHNLRCNCRGMEKRINVGRDLYLPLLLHAGDLVTLGEVKDELQMRISIL
jgi:hypothetical protein